MKKVRELGSERRETVRSLSTVGKEKNKILFLVREDQNNLTTGVLIVLPIALSSSYVKKVISTE